MKSFLLLLIAAMILTARAASAQQYLIGVSGELSDGVETGASTMLARIRARLGADLRVDEFPNDIYCVGLLTDIAPHTAFGIDGRYAHMLGKSFEVNVGAIVYIAPASLLGPSIDLKYHLPISSGATLIFGPEINVFILGSDLPGGTVFVQALLEAGIHANF